MKVFVWGYIEQVSNSYHSEGGVVVFAATEERAREIANNNHCNISPNEKPDYVRVVEGDEEKVFYFPDAGCC